MEKASYRNYDLYRVMEALIQEAGVSIEYGYMHNDSIDGEIWARSDIYARSILMPEDGDAFPDDDTACLILGHEMGHIITENDSPDDPVQRRMNEAECDQVGVYLYKLAALILEEKYKKSFH